MPYRTALIGFGSIACGLSEDLVMRTAYETPSHTDAIRKHPDFQVAAVVEPNGERRSLATKVFGNITVVETVSELRDKTDIDVAVISTPPGVRLSAVQGLLPLKALVIEKPLGLSIDAAQTLSQLCESANVLTQVNFWRRCVPEFEALRNGGLEDMIGEVQSVTIHYGNGLLNNAVHHVDFVRFLLGEIRSVIALSETACPAGPFSKDINVAFSMILESGLPVHAHALDFDFYRENSVEIWGSGGVIAIRNDGRAFVRFPIRPHGGLSNANEIAYDNSENIPSQYGSALLNLYENLARSLDNKSVLVSPINDAFKSERVIHMIKESAECGGKVLNL